MSGAEEKGCSVCRNLWYAGAQPPKLATSLQLHAQLHRCNVCGTYWEQGERYAEPIDEAAARRDFPEVFEDMDKTAAFTPANPLERSLQDAQAGRVTMDAFLRQFTREDIAIPSGGEVMADGSGFAPVLFDKEGTPMVACFTAIERVDATRHLAPYALTMKGIEFLRRVPAGHGVVVNPGSGAGFDISSQGVRNIVADFT